jgi:hypothetical protein
MFSYVSLEQRVPSDHPLREVRKLTDTVLGSLSRELDALRERRSPAADDFAEQAGPTIWLKSRLSVGNFSSETSRNDGEFESHQKQGLHPLA